MQDPLYKSAPLEAQSSNQQVDAHTTEAIFLQEGHEEAKPNKYHNMHILEHWKIEKGEKSALGEH